MSNEMTIRWIEEMVGDGEYDKLTIPGNLEGVEL